ncbi:MAG TPA: alpha/beta fold hydrolase [Saprospiraceae bacterium]|nr:alpha/beta fold hydrolase [Saprospiraceae bacterium]HNT20479.1 alpha/beta fold hydrolase [Saprospiraceae bacterium]
MNRRSGFLFLLEKCFRVLVSGIFLFLVQCKPSVPQKGLLTYTEENGNYKPVTNPAEWEIKRKQVLKGMEEAMGALPSREGLPPMDVEYTDSLEEAAYTRYDIRFVAAVNEILPAYLYIPRDKGENQKFPAMLALHETDSIGKKSVDGQGKNKNLAYAKELAVRGYVVIAPDYPGFGDLQPYDFSSDRYWSGTMKGIFDHIRCIDLLVSRPEVDSGRIGVIGHSLGGHNALFVGAFDTRLKAIISSCGWTPFADYDIGPFAVEKYGGRLGPYAQERYMPLLRDKYHLEDALFPFDFTDIIASLAPRAFFSNSPERDDNFDVRGVRKGIGEAMKVYRMFVQEDRLQVRYPDTKHDFPEEVRREAYRFLDSILGHKGE